MSRHCRVRTEDRRAPVDMFFRTLAESHRERAVAVVLSGTGANGSMGMKLVDSELQPDVERVLETLQLIEREVQTRDQRWFTVRLIPYRTADDRIDGVVMTFVDVSKRKQVEDALRRSQERLRSIAEGVAQYGIITLDPAGRIDSWNGVAGKMFGYTSAERSGNRRR
jgi:PAS domain-containing protein